jgi:hypothetical protein
MTSTWRAGFSPREALASLLPQRDSSPARTKVRPPIDPSTECVMVLRTTKEDEDAWWGRLQPAAGFNPPYRGRTEVRRRLKPAPQSASSTECCG